MTKKQEKALANLVENGGNVSKAMRDAGYSPQTAKSPSKLTDSVGFMKLMDEKGLTDDLLIESLVKDIKDKAGNRVAELSLAVKMRGRIIDRADLTSNGKDLGVSISAAQAEQLIRARAERSDS